MGKSSVVSYQPPTFAKAVVNNDISIDPSVEYFRYNPITRVSR